MQEQRWRGLSTWLGSEGKGWPKAMVLNHCSTGTGIAVVPRAVGIRNMNGGVRCRSTTATVEPITHLTTVSHNYDTTVAVNGDGVIKQGHKQNDYGSEKFGFFSTKNVCTCCVFAAPVMSSKGWRWWIEKVFGFQLVGGEDRVEMCKYLTNLDHILNLKVFLLDHIHERFNWTICLVQKKKKKLKIF